MSLSARLTIVVGSLVVDSRSLGRVVGVSVARWELSPGADVGSCPDLALVAPS